MKKALAFLCIMAFLFGAVSAAWGIPIYYTFEGTVGGLYDDAGMMAEQGIEVGGPLIFVIMFDFDRQGELTRNNGDVFMAHPDSYYADFIGGTQINEKDGGWYNNPLDTAEHNYAWNTFSDTTGEYGSDLYVKSGDDFIHILKHHSPVPLSEWEIGTTVEASVRIYNPTGEASGLVSYIALTSISSATPIPDASTLFLLGSACLIGLAGRRRKAVE